MTNSQKRAILSVISSRILEERRKFVEDRPLYFPLPEEVDVIGMIQEIESLEAQIDELKKKKSDLYDTASELAGIPLNEMYCRNAVREKRDLRQDYLDYLILKDCKVQPYDYRAISDALEVASISKKQFDVEGFIARYINPESK